MLHAFPPLKQKKILNKKSNNNLHDAGHIIFKQVNCGKVHATQGNDKVGPISELPIQRYVHQKTNFKEIVAQDSPINAECTTNSAKVSALQRDLFWVFKLSFKSAPFPVK